MGAMSAKRCLSLSLVVLTLAGLSCGNFPLLDVDTNMRIVLVPHDTPVGGIIYRLRASDSDNNFPLSFEVLGALGKSLMTLNFLGCVETESLCQADVVLKKTLDLGRTYEFQLQVKDTTGDYTKVHAAITATAGTANFNPLFSPRIIHLDESSKEGTVLEKFEVVKNELNSRTVHLELRDSSERIELKQRLVSNNRTEGTLFLKQKLDFETEPWFTFQLLAMNAWTNTSIDTRNILISEVIVAIHDVQDTPPVFTLLPASVELNSSIKTGDLVVKVEAVDGDKQNKRLIRYGFLTDSNPFVVFFDLDPMTGEIRLRRNITELLGIAKPSEPIRMTIIAEEIIQETGRFGRSAGSVLDRTMGNITFWFGRGTSFGPPVFSSDKFIGEVKENSLPGTPVQFGMALRVSHQNPTEIIALSFSSGPSGGINKGIGTANIPASQASNANMNELLYNTFQILPSQGTGNFSFEIRVANPTQLDYELHHEIKLMIMGSTTSGMFQEVEVIIYLRDENDNPPLFSQSEYRVELAEHSPIGTKVLQLKATDKDTTGNYGQVVYSNLIGSDAFHLDPETGEITVDKPELLDRELEPEIRLYVEAKDGGYTEFSDPNTLRHIATATIVIKLHDINDKRPEFLQKYYQAVLSPDFTAFKYPVFVKAYDADDGPNAQVKYQSLDTKFFVDPNSGEVRLRGAYQRNPSDGDGPYLGSFKVRAYDLGNPQQSSETVIQLFSEEMVTREIQFVFPAPPERIRKNQTNIEKMLSSLTGGIVGIQKIIPLGARSSIVQLTNSAGTGSLSGGGGTSTSGGANVKGNPPLARELEEEPTELPPIITGSRARAESDGGFQSNKKTEDLSSASDKSLVTATVQYPVSATPTRVDLAAFQKAYMTSSEPTTDVKPGKGGKDPSPDADMIKLYEAENRALFWILIAFLLILLILFAIFLCCIYCPCCWLYGHCYSKGAKSAHSDRIVERTFIEKRPQARHTRKTYPAEETEDSTGGDRGYDQDLEGDYRRRGRQGGRREAWSSEVDKKGWRGQPRRYRDRPPTPHGKARGKNISQSQINISGRAPEGDVSLEDWEFEPHHPRISDRAEEIGPRWQQIHQQQQVQLPQPQTITVPVPVSLMPLAVQQQQQQQQSIQMQQQNASRRVGYVGHAHPGDEDFVRRQQPGSIVQIERRGSADPGGGGGGPGPYGVATGGGGYVMTTTGEMERSQLPRHYPGGVHSAGQNLPPEESRAQSHFTRPRQTRFFKTETGEVLQFADFEGDEGKELLMKRFIDEQQQQHDNVKQRRAQQQYIEHEGERSLRRLGTPAAVSGVGRYSQDQEDETGMGNAPAPHSLVDRPRAAVVTKRHQRKGAKEHEIIEIDEEVIIEEEEEEEPVAPVPVTGTKTTKLTRSKQVAATGGSGGSKKLIKQDGLTLQEEDDTTTRDREKERRTRGRRNKESEKKQQQAESTKSRHYRRSHSLSDQDSDSRSKSKSTSKSKSKSRSKSPSPSPHRKSKSQSPRPPSSPSTPPVRDRGDSIEKAKGSEDQQRKKDHHRRHHHHHRTSKHERDSKAGKQHEKIEKTNHIDVHDDAGSKSKTKEKSKKVPTATDDTTMTGTTGKKGIPEVIPSISMAPSGSTSTTQEVVDSKEKKAVPEIVTSKEQVQHSSEDEDRSASREGEGHPSHDVDINIIPPSSAPMTDSSYSPKDDHEGGSLPDTPNNENETTSQRRPTEDHQVAASSSTKITTEEHHRTTTIKETNITSTRDDQEGHDVHQEENQLPHDQDDEDSGIGIVGVATSRRNKMLEKKSVFTIAYDEVAQKTLRPDTASNNEGESDPLRS